MTKKTKEVVDNMASQITVREDTIKGLGHNEPSLLEAAASLNQNQVATIVLNSIADSIRERGIVKKAEFDADVAERTRKSGKKGEKVSYIETSLVMKKNEGYLEAINEIEAILRGIAANQEEAKPTKAIKKPRKVKVSE